MKAVIKPDETFARFLGYYLSEGCVSANGNTYKIILTFALHEQEYVDDVVQGFKDLGLSPCIEKRQSTIAVYATSWLLGYVLKEVWQCGEGSANKAFPSFVFTWPKHLQREALKGLMRGDGSFTTKTNGSHAKIAFGSTSQKLFEQALALIQSQGAVPSIHYRPSAAGEIEGRPYQSLPFWELEVSNISGLTSLTQIFSQERDEQLVEALSLYQGNRYSFPRFDVSNELAFVKVRSVETKNVELCDVYDVEVENTHLFVTTSGIVTHNCFGVPTVGGEVYFDPAYNGNPLVNAMAIGLMETPEIVKSGASGIGNPVLYVGSTTGRDGMGGASFASAELSEESIQDRPAVQVGDPFLEKSLVEACLEAFKTGAVVAAQDMGAAGITCSTSEMAAKGGVGIELDLDLIPVRETGMVAYEYLLSESQERMLFVAQKGREQELIDIFHRWGLQAVVAGTVIAEPIVRILFKGEIAAEIPADALAENTPLYPREILSEPPEYVQIAWQWKPENLPESTVSGIKIKEEFQSWNQVLLTLLDTPSIASKQWVYRQYDHQVQNNTVLVPGGGDAAVIRLRPLEPRSTPNGEAVSPSAPPAPPAPSAPPAQTKGLAATVDCNSRYVYLDPYEGAKATVAEAARNLSCVGAEPIAVTDNLNFGSPEKPIGYWQLAESCRGISDGCKALNTPVTGGNVSLYNETLDADGNPESIYPTPVVGMVGLITDLTKVCGQGWQGSGDLIYLLGDDKTLPTLGASEYLAVLHGTIAGKPPRVDFGLEQKVQTACREGIRQGWIKSAHDCAEGGLAVALAESCLSGKKGATVKLDLSSTASVRWDEILFAEGGGRILVSVPPEYQSVWEEFLHQQLGEENEIWQNLGFVGAGSEALRILAADQGLIEVELGEMGDRYFNGIERRLDV